MVFPFPIYDPVDIMDSDPDAPKTKPAGSSKGESELTSAPLVLVIVPGVTVEPFSSLALLQHKSLVFVMFVNGSVGGLNADV